MGHNFSSEPVVEKETERDHNDTFHVAVSSCQGWRTTQEDNHSLMLEVPGPHKAAFFAVYDGHGSARVSKHASEDLWKHLVANELYIKGNFKEALENSFLAFDREVNQSYNAQLAGTTAVCVLIVDNVVYCANIGDSRAVASVNCECVPLSYDHKPENPQELKRILAAGGYVLGNRVNGNLALSRAFGDFHYKGNEQLPADQQIVSPCPDVTSIELREDVEFLVLACDGIWDVLSSEEVVEFVINRLRQEMEPGLICEELTTRCLATDYELVIGCDNMTVLLICYTRGRSWDEFCEDVHVKYTSKLRNKTDDTALPTRQYTDPSTDDYSLFGGAGEDSQYFNPSIRPHVTATTTTTTTNSDETNIESNNTHTNEDVPSTTNDDESEQPPCTFNDDRITSESDQPQEELVISNSSDCNLDPQITNNSTEESRIQDCEFTTSSNDHETCKNLSNEDTQSCQPQDSQKEIFTVAEPEFDESRLGPFEARETEMCKIETSNPKDGEGEDTSAKPHDLADEQYQEQETEAQNELDKSASTEASSC